MARLPDLGRRGGGYVALQALLIFAVSVVAGVSPRWPEGISTITGAVGYLSIAYGAVVLVLAFRDLGASLTAFPKPTDDSELRTQGVYRYARHPIYGGVILLALGWSLVRAPLALVPTALLVALFVAKSIREEGFLMERYPGYATYRHMVEKRFIPGIV